MRVLWTILAIVTANLWNLARWSGLPQRLNMRLSVWLLLHEPTNWSAWVQKWKAPLQRVKEIVRRF